MKDENVKEQHEEPERDFLVEAQMIIKGLTGLLPEKRHLEALQDHHEGTLIQISNQLEMLKRDVLGRP
jgi:hypothetical protein